MSETVSSFRELDDINTSLVRSYLARLSTQSGCPEWRSFGLSFSFAIPSLIDGVSRGNLPRLGQKHELSQSVANSGVPYLARTSWVTPALPYLRRKFVLIFEWLPGMDSNHD